MLRVTGAALVLLSAAALRWRLLSGARLRRRTLRTLAEAFSALESAVRVTLAPLPALLRELPCGEEARAFFDAVLRGLARERTLAQAWEDAARSLPLGETERAAVAALGGAPAWDEQSFCAALRRTAELLDASERRLASEEREQGRVTTALCLGGGAVLCIMLL